MSQRTEQLIGAVKLKGLLELLHEVFLLFQVTGHRASARPEVLGPEPKRFALIVR